MPSLPNRANAGAWLVSTIPSPWVPIKFWLMTPITLGERIYIVGDDVALILAANRIHLLIE